MINRKLADEFHKWMYEQYSAKHGNLAGNLDEYGVYLVASPSSIPEKFFSRQTSGASEPLFIKLAEDLASRGLVRFTTDRKKIHLTNKGFELANMNSFEKILFHFNINPGLTIVISIAILIVAIIALFV
jgi:Leu/Phe-tRNA-protein transferase